MTRTKSDQHDAQRKLILDNAADAFAELGFPGASMAHIATRCGVSKSLLYHYYTSKEQLLFDLLAEYMLRLVALTETLVDQPAKQRFAFLVREFMAEYQTSQQRHKVLLNDLKYLAPRQRKKIVEYERAVVATFAQIIEQAFHIPTNTQLSKPLTMMLFGMMNWTFTWLKPARGLSYEQFAELVLKLFTAGVPQTLKAR